MPFKATSPDTHALGPDTHAASLTGSLTQNVANDGQNESVQNNTNTVITLAGNLYCKIMVANTSEQDCDTTKIGTVTASNAQNVLFASLFYVVENNGASASTFTYRIRLDTTAGTIIASETTASIAAAAMVASNLFGALSDVSVAAHDIECTVQRNTNAQAYDSTAFATWGIASANNTDTHAATLTGAGSALTGQPGECAQGIGV